MAVVIFNYTTWALSYPAIASSVTEDQASAYFNIAQLYLDNTDGSVVRDINTRATLLNMLVAHIAYLNLPTEQGGNGAGTVGRAASGARGSVSVSLDYPASSSSSAMASWLNQTQYGAMFYAAMLPYRQARYISTRRVQRQVFP